MRIGVMLAAVVLGACSEASAPKAAPDLVTGLPRALTANETRVAQASNAFTLSLFRRLDAVQHDSNVFVSPLSVSFSLGMAMNGAAGTTLDQMRTTLGFGDAAMSDVDDGYRSLIALEGGLDPTTTFSIANSVWYRAGFPVLSSFTDTVKSAFSADVNASPFDQSTVDAVNGWVKTKTNGKIPTILQSIDSSDVMFLVNAIYFKGSWREQFNPALSLDATFQSAQGPQTVRMMKSPHDSTQGYAERANYVIGERLYGDGTFAMDVLVPKDTTTAEQVVAELDSTEWNAALGALRRDPSVTQVLPKFKLAYERSLAEDLQSLGMQVPFVAGGADFSNMSSLGTQLFIAFVKHKTYVDVNEEGTEAAAVTNTGIEEMSAPPCVCANRPFVFVIRERFSGTILFIGKIARVPE